MCKILMGSVFSSFYPIYHFGLRCTCENGLVVSTRQFCPSRLAKCQVKAENKLESSEPPYHHPTEVNPTETSQHHIPENHKLFGEISHMESDIAESIKAKVVNISGVIDQYNQSNSSQNNQLPGEYR